jgi:sialate O-acetylesterase
MKTYFFIALFFFSYANCNAEIKLPKLISDGMVLQRDVPLKIWGWAAPNEKVTVSFNKKNYKTTTTSDGKWHVKITAQKTGGPFTMDINGTNKITISNIVIGDVWLCSGQSNMVHQMSLHNVTYAKEVAEANNANIRHFWVPTATKYDGPADDFPANANWKVCTPENVLPFSAVAYFFALKIYEKYQIPIGLINASVGGTPIEAWMSEDGFKEFENYQKIILKNKDTSFVNSFTRRPNNNNTPLIIQDKGLIGIKKWYEQDYIPKGWKNINVPGYWEDQGIKDLNGTVWYRKEINIPASMLGKNAKVFLGRIIDADVLYINGKQIGNTTYQYPQRRYNVPNDLLKLGKNIFVVKVTNNTGKGGFITDKPYCIFTEKDTIDLKGTWQYKVGEVFIPRNFGGGGGGSFGGGNIPPSQNSPTSLYNAMIAPAINFAVKGFLWYQGESNSSRGAEYAKLQPAQITDWRGKWQNNNLPFLYVQLPGFMDANYIPSESQWAELREAQLQSLTVNNTGMAVAIDLGEWNDIHPDNKKSVGERLALAALKVAYNENIVHSGPIFQSQEISGNKIILSFTNIGSGLKANDDEDLREFAIAGADKKFVWAKAKIVGDKIEVTANEITSPLYIRYGWADNPDCNLFNKEGLPASPFRTDKKN